MAIGAEKSDILRMVIGQGLRVAFIGTIIGALAAIVCARLLSSFSNLLHGVGASDPLTLVFVTGVLIAVAVLACYLPARCAMNVNPTRALRYE